MNIMTHEERMGKYMMKNRDYAYFLDTMSQYDAGKDTYSLSEIGTERSQRYIDYKRKLHYDKKV